MRNRLSILLTSSLLLLASLSGCGPFWVDPYITVRPSHLNWMEIHYYSMTRKPYRRIAVYMNGAGHVEIRKGYSELISNDFAKRYDDASWDKIQTRRITIAPDHANEIFQQLVNFGLLDKEKLGMESEDVKFDRFIAVKANISNYTYSDNVNIFEVDPDLAEVLLDVVREFDTPATVR